MPFMDGFKLEPLPRNWHDETVAWRETYFPEMPEVIRGGDSVHDGWIEDLQYKPDLYYKVLNRRC